MAITLDGTLGVTTPTNTTPIINSATTLQLQTNGSTTAVTIDASQNVLVVAPSGLGYGTGSGGTVTQATSRTTGVTLNKPTGSIVMFTAAGSTTPAQFTVTNSTVVTTDTIVASYKGSSNVYQFLITNVGAGSFNITFYTTGGVVSDTPTINFAVIKGSIS